MVIVLEMGSRQITHIPVLICRDSYKGRTGAWQITLYHKPLGSDGLDSWHLCLPVGQLGSPNIHGYLNIQTKIFTDITNKEMK